MGTGAGGVGGAMRSGDGWRCVWLAKDWWVLAPWPCLARDHMLATQVTGRWQWSQAGELGVSPDGSVMESVTVGSVWMRDHHHMKMLMSEVSGERERERILLKFLDTFVRLVEPYDRIPWHDAASLF